MLEQTSVPLLTLGKDRGKVKIFDGPTIRLNIKLDPPDESNSSEFSYVYLIEGKNDETPVNEDIFSKEDREEEERLQKIADSFNSKYGGSSKKSKKRKRNIGDLVDRGEGYHEDSFVDNSEAYDEVVPWCLDTKHGGFYINEGVLDFIKNDDSDLEDGQPLVKKEKLDDNKDLIKKKSKLGDQKKQKIKRKMKPEGEVTSKVNEEVKPTSVPVASSTLMSKPERAATAIVPEKVEITLAEEEASELEESFNNVNNTSIEEQIEDPTVGQLITELTCEIIQKVALARASLPPAAAGDNQIPQLFSSTLMECLTRLHSLCQTRKNEEKHSVFEKISSAYGCQKEQLYKKIKRYRMNLLLEELCKRKVELNEAVSRVMPTLVEKYKRDVEESNKLKMMTKEVSGDSDAEEGGEGKTDAEKNEKAKRIMAPRRKFIWSMEIRNLLCEVVNLKMRHFDMAKIKSQSAEEHLKSFLETEVKQLWPSGWILTRALYKESKPAHVNWTGDQVKVKKGASSTVVQSSATTKSLPPTTAIQQQQQHLQGQQCQPHQLPQQSANNQQQATSGHRQQQQQQHHHHHHLNHSNVSDDPIVINLDESDNESKAPPTPVGKHTNKNLFTQLKERPSQEAAGRSESKPQVAGVASAEKEVAVPHGSTLQARNEVAFGGNVAHSSQMATASPVYPIHTKELQTCHKTNLDSPPKFVSSISVAVTENKEQSKQEHAFSGKFVSASAKPFLSSPLVQMGGAKQKAAANPEEAANIFLGIQSSCVPIDFHGDVPQQVYRKRTSSQTNTAAQYSETTGHLAVQAAKAQPETPPAKQTTQRNVFDIGSQNQVQKSPSSNREGSSYHPPRQQTPPSSHNLYPQQQQYQQQYQPHKQQQTVKKSPKQDKMPCNQSSGTGGFMTVQPQATNLAMSSVKLLQQQGAITKPDGVSEAFAKDHHQVDMSRGRQNDSTILQRGFPSGTAFVQSSEPKMSSSFQKSPVKKDAVVVAQNQGYAAFQNLSHQNKQQQQQLQHVLLKSPQAQSNQQAFGPRLPLDQSAAHHRHQSPQAPSNQQVRSAAQQHYPQQFFRGQNFPPDGSTQPKN